MNRLQKHLATVVALVTVGFVSCVTVEESNRRALAPLPDGYMNSLGAKAYDEMKHTDKISTDKAMTAKVAEIGARIAKASGKNYDWDFTLFQKNDVNAFCLPGGKVGVLTGIIPVALTNAGLAAVIGHEVGHAVARHSGERMSHALLVTGALVSVDQVMRDSKLHDLALGALGLGAQVGVMLPFSRLHETEADHIGLEYMARAGYDPREAVTLWHRMAKAGGAAPPQFLSTHPDSEARARDLESRLKDVIPEYEKSSKIPTTKL